MAVRVRVPLAAPLNLLLIMRRILPFMYSESDSCRNRLLIAFVSAASFLALSSCSSGMGPLAANNFDVTPSPLETQGGLVTATVYGKFPAKYMNKKKVKTWIPKGKRVEVLWYSKLGIAKVKYDGKVGFVFRKQLKK